MKIYYVDIDDTICHYEGERDYNLAVPLRSRINAINSLFDSGNRVVYWTARGSTTGIDWSDVTKKQLISWGAKHHDLLMGKPHYDVYIDDKSINSEDFFRDMNVI
jgi:hypothetical protein